VVDGGLSAARRRTELRGPEPPHRTAVRNAREDAGRASAALTKVRTDRKKSVDVVPIGPTPGVFFTVGTGVLRALTHHTIPVKDSPHRLLPDV